MLTFHQIVLAMLMATVVMAFIRLLLGPDLPDRVVALELIGVTVVGIIIVHALQMERPVFLDAAIVVALIGFLGTVTFARFLEKKARHD
jgi:multicomponent Na+:H+ antiporter subunit F